MQNSCNEGGGARVTILTFGLLRTSLAELEIRSIWLWSQSRHVSLPANLDSFRPPHRKLRGNSHPLPKNHILHKTIISTVYKPRSKGLRKRTAVISESMQSIPSELKVHIGTFCTRATLASLAQVHTSYQKESERTLYRRISIQTSSEEVTCLETLSSNSEKAGLVRSLTIEFPRRWSTESCNTALVLSRALDHTHALSHLRIKLPLNKPEDDSVLPQLNRAIRSDHFRLVFLYCNNYLDVGEIIRDQPQLQLLGIYTCGGDTELLRKLTSLRSSEPTASFPIIVALDRESFLPFYDHISVFPTFCRASRSAIFPSCNQSFLQYGSRGLIASADVVAQVSIYLDELLTPGNIHDMLRDMARSFPFVSRLNIALESPDICYPDLAASLSVVTHLTELHFHMWNDGEKNHPGLSHVQKQKYAREWGEACPDLFEITFLDGVTLEKNEEEWEILD
ncbi:hypothetical protein Hypma_014001 [Hypsizygus marmoreus]|uniref:Uncharacterized protein n=1 Tax=Hypsizygus marmoreus TaxID=39966 RepID=A0A369KED3_HYPMA|nr:hypothetical protein Hypma_014001 [Hypsizygus marmoreus]